MQHCAKQTMYIHSFAECKHELLYQKSTSSSAKLFGADIHSLLADIGMEQENFESALQDHKRALQLLSSILQVSMLPYIDTDMVMSRRHAWLSSHCILLCVICHISLLPSACNTSHVHQVHAS